MASPVNWEFGFVAHFRDTEERPGALPWES
jgi:hypothetical protein